MCRLIESIKLKNKHLQYLEGHSRRFNDSRLHLYGITEEIDLRQVINVPETLTNGVYKCRVLYGREIESVEFQPYIPKVVRTLQVVENDTVDYAYKYEDRRELERLLLLKDRADDVLIVRNGLITDTSYSNIAFFDGCRWVTPDSFLLNGTQRQRLLAAGVVFEERITKTDLKRFQLAKPINAMLDFEDTPSVRILL